MKKVFVYRNLRKKCWSVMDWKTKRVIEHCQEVSLNHAVFKVSQKGRERVNSEKRKNVHAGVLGWMIANCPPETHSHLESQVSYNPYTHSKFKVCSSGEDIDVADKVYMNNGKVFV